MGQKYYLTREEVGHYQHILNKGYIYYKIDIGSQQYVIFPIINKDYIGIAWPLLGQMPIFTGLHDDVDVILDYDLALQKKILEKLPNSKFKILLFPNAS